MCVCASLAICSAPRRAELLTPKLMGVCGPAVLLLVAAVCEVCVGSTTSVTVCYFGDNFVLYCIGLNLPNIS